MKRIDAIGLVLLIFGLGNVMAALWMLASPISWYTQLPGAVPDFGPLNEHFVRDLGAMFLVSGALLIYAARVASWRKFVIAMSLGWYGVHAFIHVYDTLRGLVGKEHFLIDLPLVYVPTIILLAVAWLIRKAGARA